MLAYTDRSLHPDKLILDYNFPIWERLHGFWRTLPNFNPHVVSSEPGQNLEREAQTLLFPSRGNHGNLSGQEEPEIETGIDEIEDASLLDMVEGAAGAIDIDIGPEESNDNDPIQLTPFKAPSVAVERDEAHGVALPTGRKRSAVYDHARTPGPLAPTGNGRKANKRSRIESSLESVSSDQSQLTDMARGSYNIRMATIESKRQKAKLQSDQERDARRIAAEERELVLKQEAKERELVLMQKAKESELEINRKLQEDKFAHLERMMQFQLELARCGVPVVGAPILGAHPVGLEQECPSTNDGNSMSLDSHAFGINATTTFPPTWGLPEASTSHP